jgi:hypothetical protein
MLVRFRDWLFAHVRGSGIRARSRARQADWLCARPREGDFVSELKRVLRGIAAHSTHDSGALTDSEHPEHIESVLTRPEAPNM